MALTINGTTGIETNTDTGKLKVGIDDDLQIYHNGTNNYIDGNKNNIYIRNNVDGDDGGNIYIEAKSGETSIECADDGKVALYYDNSKKLQTDSAGTTIVGHLHLNSDDNHYIKMGAGNDLQIYHTGDHSYIKNDTGKLFLQAKAGEHSVECERDGPVNLYYDNVKKFETWSEGCKGRGIAHAYGRIDGQATPSIERDFGCGSITDNSAGQYTVTLTNALADNEHMIGFINVHPVNTGSQIFGFGHIEANSTTSVDFDMRRVDNDAPSVSTDDWDNIAFVIFDVS